MAWWYSIKYSIYIFVSNKLGFGHDIQYFVYAELQLWIKVNKIVLVCFSTTFTLNVYTNIFLSTSRIITVATEWFDVSYLTLVCFKYMMIFTDNNTFIWSELIQLILSN